MFCYPPHKKHARPTRHTSRYRTRYTVFRDRYKYPERSLQAACTNLDCKRSKTTIDAFFDFSHAIVTISVYFCK